MPHGSRLGKLGRGLGPAEMAYRAATDIEQPLVSNGATSSYDAVEQGNGYSSDLLYKRPAETLKWLEQSGALKLGSFKVQVRCTSALLGHNIFHFKHLEALFHLTQQGCKFLQIYGSWMGICLIQLHLSGCACNIAEICLCLL